MRATRASAAGESRACPHCKATILKSAGSCPICRHVLKFVSREADPRSHPIACPLFVEGTINHPGDGEAVEYSILMEVHDQTGKLISRQSLGVGALQRAEKRTFSLRVELSSAAALA
jgi:hypothetical protein